MSEQSERIGASGVSAGEGGPLSVRSARIANTVRLVSPPAKEGS
jgi:hypothetical protein